jgi:hypothetical protein
MIPHFGPSQYSRQSETFDGQVKAPLDTLLLTPFLNTESAPLHQPNPIHLIMFKR